MSSPPALHLQLEFTRAAQADETFVLPGGEVEYVLRTEGGGAEVVTLDWSPALFSDLDAVRRPGCDPAVVQRLGRALRKFLARAGWARHEEAIVAACGRDEAVFITFRSNAAELYALPWELCALQSSGQHLGELPGVLVRYAWPETRTRPEDPFPLPEGGRILLGWSAAAGAVPLREQLEAIRGAAERGHHPFDPGRDVVDHLSLGRLERALAREAAAGEIVTVLHLLCHGGQAGQTHGLCWDADGEGGERALIDAGRLRQILAPHAGKIRLVVLSACDSGNAGQVGNHLGSVAQNLHQAGIHAVIASRFPLSVEGSIRFTETFYDKLLVEPTSVEGALGAARRRLLGQAGRLDWASLTLHARPEDGDDTRPVTFRPYRGLLAFQPAHRRFFFGREAEVEEALADLAALRAAGKPRILVVAGASGTGKSSMVLAGVVPRLLGQAAEQTEADEAEAIKRGVERLSQWVGRRLPGGAAQQALAMLHREVLAASAAAGTAWEVAVLRPGSAPLTALDAALGARRDAARPFLLVVDQLEEIFTHVQDPAVRQAFVARLWKVSSGDGGIHCIASIRVDFVGECGQVVVDEATGLRLDRVAYDEAHRVFVAQMGAAQLRAVIEEPARRLGLTLQGGLASRMVADVGAEPSALPLLEYTLDLLWERRAGRMLRAEPYEELGGVFGALERMADAVVDRLDEVDQRVARRLLCRLVHFGDGGAANTRRRVPLTRMAPPDPERRARFDAVLARFVDARLLLRQDEGGQIVLEISHEALLRRWRRLGAWLAEDRARIAEIGKLERWAADHKAHGALIRGAQLGYARQIRDQAPEDLDEDALAMLAASERAEEEEAARARAQQRSERRRLLAGGAAAGLLAIAMAVLFLRASAATRIAERAQGKVEEEQAQASAAYEEARAQLRLAGAWTLFARHQHAGAASLLLWEGADPGAATHDPARLELAQRILGELIPKRTFRGHRDKLWDVAWDAAGQRLVTASGDRTAHIWSADGRGRPVTLEHDQPVFSAAFDRKGRVLTACADHVARIWSIDGPTPQVQAELRHAAPIYAAVWSPDGERVAAGSEDGMVTLWDVGGADPRIEATLSEHKGSPVVSVNFGHDGKRLLSASWDRRACLWSLAGKPPRCFRKHAAPVTYAELSPDGQLVVSSSHDGTARIWDAATGEDVCVLRGHRAPVNLASFQPGSGQREGHRHLVATASDDNTIRLWALANRPRQALKGNEEQGLCTAVEVLFGHDADVTSVAFSPRGDLLVTGSWDETVRLWDLSRLPEPVLLDSAGRHVTYAVASPDLMSLVALTAGGAMSVSRPFVGAEEVARSARALTGEGLVAAAWSPDSRSLVTGSEGGALRLERADVDLPVVGGPEKVFAASRSAPITALAWNREGTRFVSASSSGAPLVWETRRTEGYLAALRAPDKDCTAAAWGPSSEDRPIALGYEDGTVLFVGVDQRAPLVMKERHGGAVLSIAWARDGGRVVTASQDRSARVWDAAGERLHLLQHPAPVLSAVFDARGERVLTRSRDNAVRVWDPGRADGPIVVLGGFEATVPLAAFDASGERVITVDARGFLQRWDIEPAAVLKGLAQANEDCLPVSLRRRYLGEDEGAAWQGRCACEQERGRTPEDCKPPPSAAPPAGGAP